MYSLPKCHIPGDPKLGTPISNPTPNHCLLRKLFSKLPTNALDSIWWHQWTSVQNSIWFFGAAAFYTTKIYDFRRRPHWPLSCFLGSHISFKGIWILHVLPISVQSDFPSQIFVLSQRLSTHFSLVWSKIAHLRKLWPAFPTRLQIICHISGFPILRRSLKKTMLWPLVSLLNHCLHNSYESPPALGSWLILWS